jgi:flagellar protein FliS
MLYDGAIESLEKAATAMTAQQRANKIRYIDKSLAIIDELLNALNPEVGGEVAENLMHLYLYMMQELTIANAQNNANKLFEIIELLKQLKSGWTAIRGVGRASLS